jgi:putative transposase
MFTIFSNFKKKLDMRKSSFSESQRLAILAKADSGQSIEDICRSHQISPATFYKWKKEMAVEQDEAKRKVAELERENNRLKKMYAELSLDHQILQDGYEMLKKWQAQDVRKK